MLVNNTLGAIEMGIYSRECTVPIESDQKEHQMWEKESIEYVKKNRDKILKHLRRLGRSSCKQALSQYDAEEVISMLIEQLYRSPDYDINIASERSKNGEIVSIEGYVNYQATCCLKKFNTETYKRNKDIAKDYVNDSEGKELSPLDTVEDVTSTDTFDEIIYDVEESCRQCQSYRYKYGVDLYMVLYIGLLINVEEANRALYFDIMETLGMSRKELALVTTQTKRNETVSDLFTAVARTEHSKAISEVEKYVYSANKIREFTLQYA